MSIGTQESNKNTLEQIEGKRKKTIKYILIAGIIIIIASAALYGMYQSITRYPALKMTVSTGVNETDGFPIVTNVTYEQIKVIYKGANDPVVYPDLSAIARNSSLMAPPVSYWSSVPWNPEEGNGTHTMTMTFMDTYKPQKGDVLIITIRMTGARGFVLTKKTALYEWN